MSYLGLSSDMCDNFLETFVFLKSQKLAANDSHSIEVPIPDLIEKNSCLLLVECVFSGGTGHLDSQNGLIDSIEATVH